MCRLQVWQSYKFGPPIGKLIICIIQQHDISLVTFFIIRDGKAIEMSFDHKPEDTPERDRIENAGGKVTPDGRVNGGLNLSRAIGDHAYKTNKNLPLQGKKRAYIWIFLLNDIKGARIVGKSELHRAYQFS